MNGPPEPPPPPPGDGVDLPPGAPGGSTGAGDPAWERLQELFDQASTLSPEDREPFLRDRCPDEPALVEQLLGLLQEDARHLPLLDGGLAEAARRVAGSPPPPVGQVGKYRLLEFLGEGGMGVVYRAGRDDLEHEVALKMLRDAWLSPARRDRFQHEQHTLARLEHPGIARFLDAGTLPDGTPFIVMELVRGLPLTGFCASRELGLKGRLSLFREVCEAVRYAHSRLVIHRDLKPSNILVTDEGRPKLLDFGIARTLESMDAPGDPTRTILRMLTPAYAAPEQRTGDPSSILTDVYSLGVILYELLAGRLPEGGDGDPRDSPPAPGSEPRAVPPSEQLSTRLPGIPAGEWADLDVLCLKAMHRDPARRYASVDALIRDLDAFAARRPLEARPDSMRYRVGKFLSRHRGRVAASVGVAAVLAATVTTAGMRLEEAWSQAETEAYRASLIREYLVDLFEAGDPFMEDAPAEVTAAMLLERGVERMDGLEGPDEVRADLLHTLGRLYTNLSDYETAATLLEEAEGLSRSPAAAGGLLPSVLMERGRLLRMTGDLEEAEPLFREAIELLRGRSVDPDPVLAQALTDLGVVLSQQGRYEEAALLLDEAVERFRAAVGDDGSRRLDLAGALTNQSVNVGRQGDYAGAERLLRESMELTAQVRGEDTALHAMDLGTLGVYLEIQGNLPAADSALTRAVAILRDQLGDRHYQTGFALNQLGGVLQRGGELERAREHLEESLEILREVLGSDHPNTAGTLTLLGATYRDLGQPGEAAGLLEEALDIMRSAVGEEHEYSGSVECHLARALHLQTRLQEARDRFASCLGVLDRVLGADHDVNAGFRILQALLMEELGDRAEAERLLLDAHNAFALRMGADAPPTLQARGRVADFYARSGRPEEEARWRLPPEGAEAPADAGAPTGAGS